SFSILFYPLPSSPILFYPLLSFSSLFYPFLACRHKKTKKMNPKKKAPLATKESLPLLYR
ncbi:MAG: hypothetical protein MJZ51_04455, partial [Bacteroidales bacterium]|nr:hypothetical protein [Bacteroidales bacterium]